MKEKEIIFNHDYPKKLNRQFNDTSLKEVDFEVRKLVLRNADLLPEVIMRNLKNGIIRAAKTKGFKCMLVSTDNYSSWDQHIIFYREYIVGMKGL